MINNPQRDQNDLLSAIRRRVRLYLTAVGLDDSAAERLTADVVRHYPERPIHDEETQLAEAMNAVTALLKEQKLTAEDQTGKFIKGGPTPPIRRQAMTYQRQLPLSRANYRRKWLVSLVIRRTILSLLTLASSAVAAFIMTTFFISDHITRLETAIIIVYTLLFTWIAFNFWATTIGFVIAVFGGDRWRLQPPKKGEFKIPETIRTAVIMPIYNEDVDRVYAGIQAIYESLKKTGELDRFDIFILSDSTDPVKCMQEKAGWAELCHSVDGFGKIFYRHRKNRIHKKSGNVSDFCRRWGHAYTYMVPLDADSLIDGPLLVQLVGTIEQRPDIGIVQTGPRGINQKTLFARMNQFSSHVNGPTGLIGMEAWQLDDASFWGHNAIVRVEPFIKYCALPNFGGKPPFGGEILSHDFVEAALMRRAGYGVWLCDRLEETYEELPPNLLTEFERDLRWCRGNLQHLRLLFTRGFSFAHRLLFIIGNLFYFSSLLWFLSLILITAYAVFDAFETPVYFSDQPSLFPDWPARHWNLSVWLFSLTAVFLFVPKIWSMVWILITRRNFRSFGGFIRLVAGLLLETLFSVFLAPIRMLMHTRFIIVAFLGKTIDWKRQNRYAEKAGVWESIRVHWLNIVVGIVLAGITYVVNPSLFLWLLTIVVPLIVSVPFSIFLSYEHMGQLFKRWGLFLAPVETQIPDELTRMNALNETAQKPKIFTNGRYDIASVIADPKMQTLLTKWRKSTDTALTAEQSAKARGFIMTTTKISPADARRLINNPQQIAALHHALWRIPEFKLPAFWQTVMDTLPSTSAGKDIQG